MQKSHHHKLDPPHQKRTGRQNNKTQPKIKTINISKSQHTLQLTKSKYIRITPYELGKNTGDTQHTDACNIQDTTKH